MTVFGTWKWQRHALMSGGLKSRRPKRPRRTSLDVSRADIGRKDAGCPGTGKAGNAAARVILHCRQLLDEYPPKDEDAIKFLREAIETFRNGDNCAAARDSLNVFLAEVLACSEGDGRDDAGALTLLRKSVTEFPAGRPERYLLLAQLELSVAECEETLEESARRAVQAYRTAYAEAGPALDAADAASVGGAAGSGAGEEAASAADDAASGRLLRGDTGHHSSDAVAERNLTAVKALAGLAEVYMTHLCDDPEAESQVREAVSAGLRLAQESFDANYTAACFFKVIGNDDAARCHAVKAAAAAHPELLSALQDDEGENTATSDAESPADWQTRVSLARLLVDVGAFPEAHGVLRLLREDNAFAPQPWLVLAHCYFAEGRFDEAAGAVAEYRKTVRNPALSGGGPSAVTVRNMLALWDAEFDSLERSIAGARGSSNVMGTARIP